MYSVIRWKPGAQARWQLFTLAAGVLWLSGSVLAAEDLFGFATFAFPGVVASGLTYTVLSRPFQKRQLMLVGAVAAWISIALFVGWYDCCATPSEVGHHYIPLGGGTYHNLKTPSEVSFEIFQIAVPGIALGLLGWWWLKRFQTDRFRRIEWEVKHSAAHQPFPEVTLEKCESLAAPIWNYCFCCHCGAEVTDEMPERLASFTAGCPMGCYEFDLVRKGNKLQIVACR